MRRSLSKGLSQLIGENLEEAPREVDVDTIVPNKRQPRRRFEEGPLGELAESIRIHGVLSPLLVRPVGDDRYELIAGERRLRASKLAGLDAVPVRLMAVSGKEALEIALIENVQRADISAAESALAYRQLIDEFGLTQDQVAERVGKSRPTIANTLRLLKLAEPMLVSLEVGEISEGHARALLGIESPTLREKAYRLILDRGISVREVERIASEARPKEKARPRAKDPMVLRLETSISERLASPVKIDRGSVGGKISIAFADDEDLERVLEALGVRL